MSPLLARRSDVPSPAEPATAYLVRLVLCVGVAPPGTARLRRLLVLTIWLRERSTTGQITLTFIDANC